jgi:ribose transport system ATP-binding protein
MDIDRGDGTVLIMEKIEKSFSGVKVLIDVNFDLNRGEVHCLLGENGAGKSTLVKILMGVYQKDRGTVLIDREKVEFRNAEDARSAGIAMVFQELSLVPQLSIAENIFLNAEERGALGFTINNKAVNQKAKELLDHYRMTLDPKDRVENLGMGFRQMVEIMKALSQDAKILIMDEPTASLTKEEEQNLIQTITNLKKRGVAIIYITHRLAEVFKVGDRVTILRDGKKVATLNIEETNMESLVEMMVGGKLTQSEEKSKHRTLEEKIEKKTLLSIRNLSQRKRIKDISFDLHYGEILGITGLIGSGKSEIARALFGIDPITGGEVWLDGKKIRIRSTKDAINMRLALIPESRRKEGLVTIHSVTENIVLPIIEEIARWYVLNDERCARVARKQVQELKVVTPSVKKEVQYLSGGNQQKVVVGKWLTRFPKVMILDEPTTGVDVNAKRGIWDTVFNLANTQKCGILLFSSDLNEVISLSDRILVLVRGQVFTELSNSIPIEETTLYRAIQGIK